MKRLLSFISALLILGASMAFADVSVKKLDNGKIEVTFFYGNPRAQEVLLAGDFTDWQNGAVPMEKGEKGFTYVKVVNPGTTMRYKFISDGNWTEDLREPDKVDDGFGGHNGLVDVDALCGPADGGAKKSGIKFMTWSMIGTQSNFLTQGAVDKTKKGLDLDSQTIGIKSYNKVTGDAVAGMPFYVEIALAEVEMEKYAGNENLNYLYKKDNYGNEVVGWKEGLIGLTQIATNPVEYLGMADDNSSDKIGPGSNPYLGHLKFGFSTPWVNYTTGFNYAKPEVRQPIIWKTIDGNWDAGYNHVGGFSSFVLGEKLATLIDGVRLDVGFAPNKTADRKGTKYGYWGWAGATFGDFAVDFQSNGAYDGAFIFDDPVEHDFIIGGKGKLSDLGLSFAAQALIATHQKSTADLKAAGASSVLDWSGYSTDVWARSGKFDGLRNMAFELDVGYKMPDMFEANFAAKIRGAQASMLYLRQNHDDGTFDLSNTLGNLNSMNFNLNGAFTGVEGLVAGLDLTMTLPLETIKEGDKLYDTYLDEAKGLSWYESRFSGKYEPLFGIDGGFKMSVTPSATYDIGNGMKVGAYADMGINAYKYVGDAIFGTKDDNGFSFDDAGITFSMGSVGFMKGLDVYYGLDNTNSNRMFNTLTAAVKLPLSMTVSGSVGLKTLNKGSTISAAANNMFAGAVGFSKKLEALQKPTVYTQFVYNMDPYKHFGDGQDNLNLSGANVKGSHEKEGAGCIDAVDWYDGRAAFRVGMRWDF